MISPLNVVRATHQDSQERCGQLLPLTPPLSLPRALVVKLLGHLLKEQHR